MIFRHQKAPRLLDQSARIACFTSPAIGDSLISMVTAENLRRSGRTVTVFSQPLLRLERWFPQARIEPIPPPGDRRAILREYDLLFHAFDSHVLPEAGGMPNLLVYDRLREYRGPLKPQVEVHRDLCRSIFGIEDASKDNGMRHPEGGPGPDDRRVIIHPRGNDPRRVWSDHSFKSVADGLVERGWHPEFVTLPSDIESTRWIEESGYSRLATDDLDRVATHLTSARAYIGNDSGIAHLASSIGLPFVTVNMRRKLAVRWRPGWSEGEALIPSIPLLVNPIKVRFWRRFITPGMVLAAFDRVVPPPAG